MNDQSAVCHMNEVRWQTGIAYVWFLAPREQERNDPQSRAWREAGSKNNGARSSRHGNLPLQWHIVAHDANLCASWLELISDENI